MLQLEFSEADKRALNHERYHHPHPRVQQRMEALWLKSQGLPHQRIATLCAISGNTLRAYLKLYQAGGMEALKQLNFYRPQSLLSEQRETLEAHLRAHPPHTINEAISVIEALTGIRRSPTQIRVFLKQLGLKCLKVGLLPAKGDPEEQETYQKKVRAPLSRSTRGGACGLFCGCSAFCLRRVSRLPLVFRPVLDQGTQWAAALQCLGRAQCGHPRRDHRHHADLHQFPERLPITG
jgi:transposase